MNTPGHLILNLTVLGGPRGGASARAILAGGLLPDVPLFIFYGVQRLGLGHPEHHIWQTAYFEPAWQHVFDLAHSIPLALLGIAAALYVGARVSRAFFSSWLLHALCDLALHHDDAHRHFSPLASWRFESPISYWDPAHHGTWVALLELVLVGALSTVLWRRFKQRAARTTLLLTNLLYAGAYAAFYLV